MTGGTPRSFESGFFNELSHRCSFAVFRDQSGTGRQRKECKGNIGAGKAYPITVADGDKPANAVIVNLKVEALIKFDNAVNAVRVFELKPDAFSASIQAAGMDLQVAGIIRTDANALFGKELGPFFGADGYVDDNA